MRIRTLYITTFGISAAGATAFFLADLRMAAAVSAYVCASVLVLAWCGCAARLHAQD